MPGSATNFLEDKLLDHALGTTMYTKPANVYVALYTTAPSDSSDGVEVTGGSYARQLATFTAALNGSASNNTNIDFTNMPAGTINAIGILTSNVSGSGDLLFWSTLTTSRTLTAGDNVRITSGALTVTLD